MANAGVVAHKCEQCDTMVKDSISSYCLKHGTREMNEHGYLQLKKAWKDNGVDFIDGAAAEKARMEKCPKCGQKAVHEGYLIGEIHGIEAEDEKHFAVCYPCHIAKRIA